MSPRQQNQHTHAFDRALRRTQLDLRVLVSLGCLSLMGGGAVFAQADMADPAQVIPAEKAAPAPAIPAPAAPAPTPAAPAPVSDLGGVPAEVIFEAPVAPAPIERSASEPAAPVALPSVLDDLPADREPAPAHSYIDDTDYSIGATQPAGALDRAATVVLEDRSTGCASSIAPGQSLANGLCANAVFGANGSANGSTARANGRSTARSTDRGYVPTGSAPMAASPLNLSNRNSSFDPYAATGLSYAQIEAQVTRNLAIMPMGRIGNNDTGLLFPVSVPSPISSFFGFRTHPIAGVQRLHTGTDIAAPYGSPVLAAFSGEVVESASMGGYGLTVILSHNDGMSETLYAHMSELLVEAGDEVEQGDPIGRIGSTGFSTGPHLHFEVKQMSDMGWVYLDANRQLEIALERLIDTSQLAQLPLERDRD